MKWALLSDVHANLSAWQACVAHAQTQGVTHWAVLGDLVGYGPQPAEVVDAVKALHSGRGAVVLRGNHEVLALRGAHGESMGALTAQWTHGQLGAERLQWLSALPLTHVDGALMLVHASADAPERWHYVEDARGAARSLDAALAASAAVRYVMGGHVHHQTLYYRGQGQQLLPFKPTPGVAVPVPAHRCWVATIGSVGQPRDGDTRAAYATLDVSRQQLCFHRVAYDHLATARTVRAASLPEMLAERLERGR
ncbi:MAG: metallophosphoesterase family protein [Alphaproteobacteria bacterium]|nr:metallophosphoesterase family protein [Alphaproteobacteria bacterium]